MKNETKFKITAWFAGIIAAIASAVGIVITGRGNDKTNNKRIQSSDDLIESGRGATGKSVKRNRDAQKDNREAAKHTESAGKNISDARESVGAAKSILERARKREKK